MQDASECQDPVTTRQDQGQTCWDVSAKVKPSLVCPVVTCRCRQEFVGARAKGHGSNPPQGVPGRQDHWAFALPPVEWVQLHWPTEVGEIVRPGIERRQLYLRRLFQPGSGPHSTSAGPELRRTTGTAGFRVGRPGLMATVAWLTTCCGHNQVLASADVAQRRPITRLAAAMSSQCRGFSQPSDALGQRLRGTAAIYPEVVSLHWYLYL
jgi:hypothetical protein